MGVGKKITVYVSSEKMLTDWLNYIDLIDLNSFVNLIHPSPPPNVAHVNTFISLVGEVTCRHQLLVFSVYFSKPPFPVIPRGERKKERGYTKLAHEVFPDMPHAGL